MQALTRDNVYHYGDIYVEGVKIVQYIVYNIYSIQCTLYNIHCTPVYTQNNVHCA